MKFFHGPKLVFYKVLGNKNRVIIYYIYYNDILEGLIKKWIERGDDFYLEEDSTSGYREGPKARKDSIIAK